MFPVPTNHKIPLLLVVVAYGLFLVSQFPLLGLFHKSIGNKEFYPAYVGYNLAGLLLVLLWADWINKRNGALLAVVVSAGVAAWEAWRAFYLWTTEPGLALLALVTAIFSGLLTLLAVRVLWHRNVAREADPS